MRDAVQPIIRSDGSYVNRWGVRKEPRGILKHEENEEDMTTERNGVAKTSRYRAPRRWSRSPGKWQEDPDESGFAEMEAGGKQLVEKEKMKTPVR